MSIADDVHRTVDFLKHKQVFMNEFIEGKSEEEINHITSRGFVNAMAKTLENEFVSGDRVEVTKTFHFDHPNDPGTRIYDAETVLISRTKLLQLLRAVERLTREELFYGDRNRKPTVYRNPFADDRPIGGFSED